MTAPRNTRRPGAEPSATPAEASQTTTESSPPPPLVKSTRPDARSSFPRVRRVARSIWGGTRIIVGIAVVVAASLGAAWGARRYVLHSQRFVIKTITVEGNAKLAPEAIATAGGVSSAPTSSRWTSTR